MRLDQGDERMPERGVVRATAGEFGIDLLIHGGSPHLSGARRWIGHAAHRIAIGVTGDPTAPVTGNGGATSRES
jgi:hypothetical protein